MRARASGRSSAQDGELQQVYRVHVGAVYAFFAYSVSPTTAEDLTASTFERVIRAWDSYDLERGSVKTWVLAIARNQLMDHYRRQRHRDWVSTDEHPALLSSLQGDDWLEQHLTADEVGSWLSELGEREREVLALRYGSDLPANEIAELMGLSPANVHQIASRSLRLLRERIQQSVS